MKGYKSIEVHIEHSISIQQQKIRIQLILDFEKCTGITQRLLLKIVFNMNSKGLPCCRRYTRTISEIVHDDVSEMRIGQNNVFESLVTQTLQLMFQNGLSFDFYHRLVGYHWQERNSVCPCRLPLSLFSSSFFSSHIFIVLTTVPTYQI